MKTVCSTDNKANVTRHFTRLQQKHHDIMLKPAVWSVINQNQAAAYMIMNHYA